MTKSKVALIQCSSYNTQEVEQAIKRGIDLLGGWNSFIGKNEKILLKPNLVMSHTPDHHATTHPAVFEAVIKLLKDWGADKITYGDSPGFGKPFQVAKKAGLTEIAAQNGIPLGNFENGSTVQLPEGSVCKQFDIAEAVLESDSLISLPKMKAHQLTRITGAIKNQLGCVYGLMKTGYHAKFPQALGFSKMLVDLNRVVKPKLFIMDGIVAMEGNGPTSGNPRPMNLIMISSDPIAMDSVFCRLIGLDPEFVPTIIFGASAGLGVWKEEEIEVLGNSIESLSYYRFNVLRKPVTDEFFKLSFITIRLRHLFIRRPVIDKRKCVKCGICVKTCPVQGKALYFPKDGGTPRYRYQKCIRCYCCQEMCPQKAITVRTPLLGMWLLYKEKKHIR